MKMIIGSWFGLLIEYASIWMSKRALKCIGVDQYNLLFSFKARLGPIRMIE